MQWQQIRVHHATFDKSEYHREGERDGHTPAGMKRLRSILALQSSSASLIIKFQQKIDT